MSELELSVIAHFVITKWEGIDVVLKNNKESMKSNNKELFSSEKGTLAWEAGIDSF